VLPSYFDAHFAEKLHKLGKKERQRVVNEAGTINGLIGNEETLGRSKFEFLPPTT
jgi:hypothetical protein